MKKIIPYLSAVALAVAAQSGLGFDRFVVVNGQLLDGYSLMELDAAAGERVPDGRYWLNYQTGAWGYKDGPIMGYIGDRYTGRRYDVTKDDFCVQNPGICP